MHEGNIKTTGRKAGLADEEKEMSSVSVISFKTTTFSYPQIQVLLLKFSLLSHFEVGLSPARKEFLVGSHNRCTERLHMSSAQEQHTPGWQHAQVSNKKVSGDLVTLFF